MCEKPIGIFDSGIGGISVLNKCLELLPQENFIYFADKEHAPYGDKKTEEIIGFMENIMDNFFVKKNVKAVVIACNTATNAAIEVLRKKYSFPIIGIEPAIKPALLNIKNEKKVLVLATESTIKSKKFLSNLNKYDNDKCIVLGCSGLVELIESNDKKGVETYLLNKFKSINKDKIDSVVLGCTHYPFIKDYIKYALYEDIEFYDGGYGVAKHLKNVLMNKGMLSSNNDKGYIDIYSSGDKNYNHELRKYIGR